MGLLNYVNDLIWGSQPEKTPEQRKAEREKQYEAFFLGALKQDLVEINQLMSKPEKQAELAEIRIRLEKCVGQTLPTYRDKNEQDKSSRELALDKERKARQEELRRVTGGQAQIAQRQSGLSTLFYSRLQSNNRAGELKNCADRTPYEVVLAEMQKKFKAKNAADSQEKPKSSSVSLSWADVVKHGAKPEGGNDAGWQQVKKQKLK